MALLVVRVQTQLVQDSAPTAPKASLRTEVVVTVTRAVGVVPEVFVYHTFGDRYSHVAMPVDLPKTPTVREQALATFCAFYRRSNATLWLLPEQVESVLATIHQRLKTFVDAYAAGGTAPTSVEFTVVSKP